MGSQSLQPLLTEKGAEEANQIFTGVSTRFFYLLVVVDSKFPLY